MSDLCWLIEHFVVLICWGKCDQTAQMTHPLLCTVPSSSVNHGSRGIFKIWHLTSFYQAAWQALNQRVHNLHKSWTDVLTPWPIHHSFFFLQSLQLTSIGQHDLAAVWLDMFHLSLHQGTASEATLIALLAARCKAINRMKASNPQLSESEIFSKLVSYTSTYVSTRKHCTALLHPSLR